MNRLILADNQAIFRAGAARVLALEGRYADRGPMRRPGEAFVCH